MSFKVSNHVDTSSINVSGNANISSISQTSSTFTLFIIKNLDSSPIIFSPSQSGLTFMIKRQNGNAKNIYLPPLNVAVGYIFRFQMYSTTGSGNELIINPNAADVNPIFGNIVQSNIVTQFTPTATIRFTQNAVAGDWLEVRSCGDRWIISGVSYNSAGFS